MLYNNIIQTRDQQLCQIFLKHFVMEGSNLENVSFPSFGGSLLTVTVFFKPRFNITIVLNLRKMPRHIFFFFSESCASQHPQWNVRLLLLFIGDPGLYNDPSRLASTKLSNKRIESDSSSSSTFVWIQSGSCADEEVK